MFDYLGSALAAWFLFSPATAIPYVTSPEKNLPKPQLHYSKAYSFSPSSEAVLNSSSSGQVHSPNAAAYSLADTYDHTNWMSKFSVQNVGDPTHGFVRYVTQSQAQSEGIYKISGNQVYIGVDSKTVLNPSGAGRDSVRLQSNTAYNRGVIIADFAHIPGTECGAWPAFWLLGQGTWPAGGEIDIIEGTNLQPSNQMTLHTSPGCTVNVGSGGQTGSSTGSPGCGDGGGFNGCSVVSNVGTSFGTPFDNVGGGVYATVWTSSQIKIYYFARNAIPADIKNGNPNPANWGAPQANFGGCNFDNFMRNMNIIFDITFCGDWAGAVWGSYPSCASSNPSCAGYVAQNPNVFSDVYWLVNSIKIYQ